VEGCGRCRPGRMAGLEYGSLGHLHSWSSRALRPSDPVSDPTIGANTS
jgi:hypothetical protein